MVPFCQPVPELLHPLVLAVLVGGLDVAEPVGLGEDLPRLNHFHPLLHHAEEVGLVVQVALLVLQEDWLLVFFLYLRHLDDAGGEGSAVLLLLHFPPQEGEFILCPQEVGCRNCQGFYVALFLPVDDVLAGGSEVLLPGSHQQLLLLE